MAVRGALAALGPTTGRMPLPPTRTQATSSPAYSIGSRIALCYSTDRQLWHERVVLAHLGATRFLLLSPDLDVLDEDIDVHRNRELAQQARSMRDDGSVLGVSSSNIYHLADAQGHDLGDNDLAAWIDEAAVMKQALLSDSGNTADFTPIIVDGGGGTGDGGAGLVAAALQRCGMEPTASFIWVTMESRGGTMAGTQITPSAETITPAGSDRGVHKLSTGEFVCIKRVARLDLECKPPGGLSDSAVLDDERVDCRTLAPTRGLDGSRHCEFYPALQLMKLHKFDDWALSGPRTTQWLMLYFFRNGGGARAYHQRWMAEVRLDYGAAMTSEHLAWCQLFEIAVTYDMLDVTNLCCLELAARRVQAIHERWKHKLPSTGIGSTGASSWEDDNHLLMGTAETRGNIGVCPALQKWLGEESAKESLAAKERRKAREERALAAKARQPDDKGGGRGG